MRGMTVDPSTRAGSPADCGLRGLRRLRELVDCDGGALLVMDPATRLFSTGAVDELPEASCHPYFTYELGEDDRTFRRMAIDRSSASRVDDETAGNDPLISVLRPHGFAAELRAVCGDAQAVWGGVTLWRRAGRAPFTVRDEDLLNRESGRLGADLRDAVVGSLGTTGLGAAEVPAFAAGALGVLLVADGEVVEASPEVVDVLRELDHPAADEYRHVDHLRALAGGPLPFTTVLRTPRGWVTAYGTRLGADRVAVTLSAAGPDRLLGTRVVAAGLSSREIEVTRLLCRGLSDREIARELGVSEHTAHDHVRAVRRKLGVRSRSEVSAMVFAEQYFEGFLASAAVTHTG